MALDKSALLELTEALSSADGGQLMRKLLASLLISLVAAVFVILVSERIYRRALMQTGGKLSIRQALKLTD